MTAPLSVGLLLGSRDVPRWFARGIERLATTERATVEQVVTTESVEGGLPDKDLRFYLDDIAEKGCWTVVAAGGKLLEGVIGPIPELERVPITELDGVASADRGKTSLRTESPSRYALPTETVDSMKELDIVVHWGVGILTGEVLQAPVHGVWGVHMGDIRHYRGGPPGFWEYIHGRSTAKVTLQRFTEDLDGGHIVVEREVPLDGARTWRAVRRRLCRESTHLFRSGVESYASGETVPETPSDLGPIYRASDRDCQTVVRYLRRAIPGWSRTLLGS